MKNKEYEAHILEARKTSPFKRASLEDVDSCKNLSPLSKQFVKLLIQYGRKVVIFTKENQADRTEVFGRFYPNENIKTVDDLEFYEREWKLSEVPHPVNETVYIVAIKPRDHSLERKLYRKFEDDALSSFEKLVVSNKYKHLSKKCIVDGEIMHERVINLISYMNTLGEFFHPKFSIDFTGQSYDFLWYPTFRDAVSVPSRKITIL